MKWKSVLLIAAVFLATGGCEEEDIVNEVVSTPNVPSGPDSAYCTNPAVYSSGGAVSSKGNSVEYRFDFDAGGIHLYGDWKTTESDTAIWYDPGSYIIKAQARSAANIGVVSPWSEGLEVTVAEPPVTRPDAPSGSSTTKIGVVESYCTGGAVSREGDPVEYRFDFDADGARDTTAWGGETCVSRQWEIAGYYLVKAQARSTQDTNQVSIWSEGIVVTVNNRDVSAPRVPTGASAYAPPSLVSQAFNLYCTGGSASSDGAPVQYQFEYRQETGGTWYTAWSYDSCVVLELAIATDYSIRARARSSSQTGKVSVWSQPVELVMESGEHPVMKYTGTDTVGMFRPFSISYHGVSPNGAIEAYAFHSDDMDIEGALRWNTDLADSIRYFPNIDDPGLPNGKALPSGEFTFKGICLDEAGYSSIVDPLYDFGVKQVTVNFDPDTRIVSGRYYMKNQDGGRDSFYVDFHDGIPDTLPYGSWIRFSYTGWDDPRDSLEFNDPPVHIRYKYRMKMEGESRSGNLSYISTAYFPLIGSAEYTNPGDVDSATATVGSFNYEFIAAAYDEQYRRDGTAATVSYIGNFQPTVDRADLGVVYAGNTFIPAAGDTFYLADPMDPGNWSQSIKAKGDTLLPYETVSGLSYRFAVKAEGHDDHRDREGSSIMSWMVDIEGAGQDLDLEGEGENIFEDTPDELLKEFLISIPIDSKTGLPDSAFVADLPGYLGRQNIMVVGYDMGATETYSQKIRSGTPVFDDNWNMIEPGDVWTYQLNLANIARKDTLSGDFYFKPLW